MLLANNSAPDLPKRPPRLVLVLALLIGIAAVPSVWYPADCWLRATYIPDVPEFPGMQFTDGGSRGLEEGQSPVIAYHYVAATQPEDVMQFYQSKGAVCTREVQGKVCIGKTFPFGDYKVYVAESIIEPISIGIDLTWEVCRQAGR